MLERKVLGVEPRGHAGGGDAAAHVGHCKPPSLDDEHPGYVRFRTASTFADVASRRFHPREHPATRAGPCRRDRDHRSGRSRGRRGGGRPSETPAAPLAVVARAAADRPRGARGVPADRQGRREDGRTEGRRPDGDPGARAARGGGARDGRRPPPERQAGRDRVRAVAGPRRSAERRADGRGPRLERADPGRRPERDRAGGGRGGGAPRDREVRGEGRARLRGRPQGRSRRPATPER